MKYMGSKNRISKYIVPIILDNLEDDDIFIDVFCGGCNLLDKIPSDINRYGNDINKYLISMWKAVAKGWMPPENITEDQYAYIRNNKNEDEALTGYVGFALSYGGKWFGGWCRDSKGARDYVGESYRNAQNQFPLLEGVLFGNKSFIEINPKRKALLYCDPPYKGATKYKDNFDHDLFYEWCYDMRGKGHTLLVSEYNMPSSFECIWEKEQVSSLTANTGSKRAIERLYKL